MHAMLAEYAIFDATRLSYSHACLAYPLMNGQASQWTFIERKGIRAMVTLHNAETHIQKDKLLACENSE